MVIIRVMKIMLKVKIKNIKRYLKKESMGMIVDINELLKNLRALPNLPDDFILCAMDIVGLYPDIKHDEGLPALRK